MSIRPGWNVGFLKKKIYCMFKCKHVLCWHSLSPSALCIVLIYIHYKFVQMCLHVRVRVCMAVSTFTIKLQTNIITNLHRDVTFTASCKLTWMLKQTLCERVCNKDIEYVYTQKKTYILLAIANSNWNYMNCRIIFRYFI